MVDGVRVAAKDRGETRKEANDVAQECRLLNRSLRMGLKSSSDESETPDEQHEQDDGIEETQGPEIDMQIGDNAGENEQSTTYG